MHVTFRTIPSETKCIRYLGRFYMQQHLIQIANVFTSNRRK